MTRAIRFFVMTVVATMVIAGLFLVIVNAPEPWQTRPWTLWERCAQLLLLVFGWPLWAATQALDQLQWRMPDRFVGPFYVILFLASGAFWAAVLEFARTRMKRTPNMGAAPNGGPAIGELNRWASS